jgi:hypothetical protein
LPAWANNGKDDVMSPEERNMERRERRERKKETREKLENYADFAAYLVARKREERAGAKNSLDKRMKMW